MFTGENQHPSRWLTIVVTSLLVALATLWNLPPTVIVFNDDFGYLRSVVATLQHERPWTDDWLEPWSASLSALSAILFKITGSFRLSTYGLQSLLAGGLMAMSTVLLMRRKLPMVLSLVWSLVFLTMPTLLWKVAEFGAMSLYVFCLLIAIWSAERGRWLWFGLAWLVALTSRQSALLWLALPVGELLFRPKLNRGEWVKSILLIGLLLLGSALLYHLIKQGMNRTNAQVVMQGNVFANLHWKNGCQQVGLALAVAVVVIGLAGFILRCSSGQGRGAPWSSRRVALVTFAIAVIGVLWVIDASTLIQIEHSFFRETRGGLYLSLIYTLAILGWCLGGFRVRVALIFSCVAAAALMALRHSVWDYYLIDVVTFAFFGIYPFDRAAVSESTIQRQNWLSVSFVTGALALIVFLGFHHAFVVRAKTLMDENYGMISLAERALRAERMSATDLADLPFGYRGWNLYPHFIANETPGRYIADFELYLHKGAVTFRIDGPSEAVPTRANGKLQEGETLLESEVLPRGWFQRRRYNLIRIGEGQPAELMLEPNRYSRPSFPLNDDEWRKLVGKQLVD